MIMLELAVRHLTPQQLREVLLGQARGSYTQALPMRYYGATPLAYMCVFGMRRPIRKLLKQSRKNEKLRGLGQ